jgi:hypothetical protein
MKEPLEIEIANSNLTEVQADLLVLKYADGFHGADKVVAQAVGFQSNLRAGSAHFCQGTGLRALEALFIGVGPLGEFRYKRIQEFGSQAVKLARKHHNPVRHLATTLHGPGYGLDLEEAFLSLIAGFVTEWKQASGSIQRITIAELVEKRCNRLKRIITEHSDDFGLRTPQRGAEAIKLARYGVRVERQPHLFVAMPFDNAFTDEFEIAFCEAAKETSFVCERMDQGKAFTGEIVSEIRNRIKESRGVIGLVNSHNPNVFFELGFALALEKPIILVAKKGVVLPFDLSTHHCIQYESIAQLRKSLIDHIAALKESGILK